MQIFLDDKTCEIQADSVGEAIAACSAAVEEQGRCLVEVVVDGQTWGQEHLSKAELANATADEVRLTSADPAELVSLTFADAAEALNDLRTVQDDAAALLQSGDHEGAMKQLSEAFTIWLSVQQAVVQGSQLVGLDLDSYKVGNSTVPEIVAALGDRLESIRTQLENSDLVGVADTLLYDLPEVIDQWREMLASLQNLIEKAPSE